MSEGPAGEIDIMMLANNEVLPDQDYGGFGYYLNLSRINQVLGSDRAELSTPRN